MIKFLKISKKDILFDSREAAALIEKAANRSKQMSLSGAFETSDRVIFVLEERMDKEAEQPRYVIVPVEDPSEDGITGEINSRHTAGFSFAFLFRIEDKEWAVYRR